MSVGRIKELIRLCVGGFEELIRVCVGGFKELIHVCLRDQGINTCVWEGTVELKELGHHIKVTTMLLTALPFCFYHIAK